MDRIRLRDRIRAAWRVYTSRVKVYRRPDPRHTEIDWVIVNALGRYTDRHPGIALDLYEQALRAKDDGPVAP